MKVVIRRSGGFAGIDEEIVNVDSETMSPDAARQLEDQVRAARLDITPARNVGADLLKYEVAITDGGQTRTITVLDDGQSGTATMRTFINGITALRTRIT